MGWSAGADMSDCRCGGRGGEQWPGKLAELTVHCLCPASHVQVKQSDVHPNLLCRILLDIDKSELTGPCGGAAGGSV